MPVELKPTHRCKFLHSPKDLLGRESGASFSTCDTYRYTLWRQWDTGDMLNFLMLNPSTADETENDPTVERCERRAKAMGYGGLIVTNLFAFRATDPKQMKAAEDPIGPANNGAIIESASQCKMVVCAWGTHGAHLNRAAEVKAMLAEFCPWKMHYLKLSKTGQPWHPLYVGYDVEPKPWPIEAKRNEEGVVS